MENGPAHCNHKSRDGTVNDRDLSRHGSPSRRTINSRVAQSRWRIENANPKSFKISPPLWLMTEGDFLSGLYFGKGRWPSY